MLVTELGDDDRGQLRVIEGVVADAGDGVADDDRGQLREEKAELPMLVTELPMTTEVSRRRRVMRPRSLRVRESVADAGDGVGDDDRGQLRGRRSGRRRSCR